MKVVNNLAINKFIMKRQRITIGSILLIPIEDYYCYAQILGKASYAFFDYKSTVPLPSFEELTKASVLFVVSVYNDVITTGIWEKIGTLPIREELETLPNQYIYHKGECPEYELYITETGEIIPSTKEETKGLECCAVWDSHHVVDRIRCYYNGEHCIWLDD